MRQVQVGQALQVQLDALPGKTFEGKVFAVNPLIDAAGRAVVIRAIVRNPDTVAAAGHVRARARSSRATRRTRWCCPSRRWCRRATSNSSIASSTARRCAPRSRWASAATPRSKSSTAWRKDDVVVTAGQLKLRDGAPVTSPARPSRTAAPAAAAPAGGGANVIAPANAAPGKADAALTPPPKS